MARPVIGPELPEDFDEPGRPDPHNLPHREQCTLKGHDGPVFAVRWDRQGKYCLTCGKDRNIILWNPAKQLKIKAYTGHGYDVRDCSVAKDNSKFASCGGDRNVFLWDVGSGRFIRKFKGHEGTANAVVFAAEDDLLVTAGYDQSIKVWDVKSRSIDAVQTMKAFQDSVTGVVVNGCEIYGCSVDGSIRRFDVRMGRVYKDELHHPITGLAVSHDGMCILGACMDSTLRLLDKQSGELLACYQGHVHEAMKMDCCLTPTDANVVGSSETGEVFYWDLVDATVVKRFQAHSGVVCSMAMHPEARFLLTGSVDGAVKVWA